MAIFLHGAGITPWHNEFDHSDYLRNAAGHDTKLSDKAALDLRMRLNKAGVRVSAEFCNDTIVWMASRTTAHPVRDYLAGLVWKREPRLDMFLHTHCGAEDNEYHRLVGAKWLIAAVRRVREPGCKFDNILVFEGAQNAGKSSVFRILAGDEYFTDGVAVGVGPKETIELTGGKWIAESAELSGLSKRDVNEVKQALSKQSDMARLSYGRFPTEILRQFVMCGTTNNAKYLNDVSGGRRFWGVTIGKIDLAALRRDRDQLWAEAAYRESQGERIFLQDAEYDLAVAEQAKREVDDPFEMHVEELLSGFAYGVVWKTDMFKALGYESAAKGGGAVGGKLGPIMAKYGWHDGRVKDKDNDNADRRCFIKAPVKDVGCDAPPPQRMLALHSKDKVSSFKYGRGA